MEIKKQKIYGRPEVCAYGLESLDLFLASINLDPLQEDNSDSTSEYTQF